jgi:hypothetical protein
MIRARADLKPFAQGVRARNSIIRRSVVVGFFYVLGHSFNYLLLVTANRVLAPAVFGIFYIGISLSNVMLAPGVVVTLILAQRFAGIAAGAGVTAVGGELRRILWKGLAAGSAIAVAGAAILALFGKLLGIDTFIIVVLVPAISLASFLFETIRAAFQGSQRFAWFSAGWVVRCALQFGMATAGLYYFGTAWAGLAGLLAANVVVGIAMLFAMLARSEAVATSSQALPRLDRITPLMLGYGFHALLVNADVLLAYLLLDRQQLATYVASSILPKAIVTATLPVAQILMPVMVAQANAAEGTQLSVRKAVITVSLLATLGAVILELGGGMACGGRFGLRSCELDLLHVLALSAIPLCLLRVLVVSSLAVDRSWRPLLQAVVLGLVASLAIGLRGGPHDLAVIYLFACGGGV